MTAEGHPIYAKLEAGAAFHGNSVERDGHIEIINFAHGGSMNTAGGGTSAGVGAGAITLLPLQLTAHDGQHSPEFLKAYTGHNTLKGELTFVRYKSDGTRDDYMTLKFENGRVVGFNQVQDSTIGQHSTTTWQIVAGKWEWSVANGGITHTYNFQSRTS